VDDDETVRRIISDALHERGFEVLSASNATEGLSMLSEELLALDLLVTDAVMPGMSGEEFVRLIRKAGGETELAIVCVSGQLGGGTEAALERAGADAVLDKALGAELIAQAADAALERKRLLAQSP
jgi:CheY-like chemotaxis protein